MMTLLITAITAQNGTPAHTAERTAGVAGVARGLAWLEANTEWVTEQQVRITEIAAPTFHESERGAYIKKLFAAYGLKVHTDEAGNAIGERPGKTAKDVVLITAHLDTVHAAGTDTRVRKRNGKLYGPGISDNGAGLAGLVAMARAAHEGRLKTQMTLIFAANTAEEGEGNLKGMRKLVQTYGKRIRYVVVLDGSATDHITASALASRRFEVVVTGPGGHSWSDFGLPNAIHAISRGVVRFIKTRVPPEPRTSFNVGEIEGGTSVNSIPNRASIKVDLRSESGAELDRMEAALREAMESGAQEEMTWAREARPNAKLEVKFENLGIRPGGELAKDSPLLAAVRDADRYLGNTSRLERSSTDANIPLSLGIPAITIGAGGFGGGAHSAEEWYDATGRAMGLKRVLLTVAGVAGAE